MQDTKATADSGTVTARIGRAGLVTRIEAGGHAVIADEAGIAGGTAQGPCPYDYVLAGLGACTAMTLRMFADRKGWPLEGVVVSLRHDRVYAEDCGDCETKSGKIDLIVRRIELQGQLDEDQRTRLMEIAERCPVHRTLSSEIKIRTERA